MCTAQFTVTQMAKAKAQAEVQACKTAVKCELVLDQSDDEDDTPFAAIRSPSAKPASTTTSAATPATKRRYAGVHKCA